MNQKIVLSALAILFIVSVCLPGQTQPAQAQSAPVTNVGATAIRQTIVYQEPKSRGVFLPVSGVVSRFETLIYARVRILVPGCHQEHWPQHTILHHCAKDSLHHRAKVPACLFEHHHHGHR